MNYRVQFVLVILAAFALPALASGNSEMSAGRTALFTWYNRAEKLRSIDTARPYHVIGGGAGATLAQTSARRRNPKTVPAASSDEVRTRRVNRDQTLEIPQALDSRSSDQAGNNANSDHQKYDDDLQLGQPGEAKGATQGFLGTAHRLGTMRDYEDQAKDALAAEVCIASQWWWTSGVAVCTPIAPSSRAASRGQL
jgi:hypothetical protein